MKTRKAAALICAAAMILPLAACEERPVETVGTTTTAAIVTKAETTATAETTTETTTIPDDNSMIANPGVFAGWIMLGRELRAIYPLDTYVLLETEEGYFGTSPYYDMEWLSAILTDKNFRGVAKKVTDEAEKNGSLDLIQNELQTDFENGMNVYFNGEDALLLIRVRDSDHRFYFDWENLEAVGEVIPYDVPEPEPGQFWYAFFLDPNTEPMKPITTVEDIAPGHFGVFNGWIMLDGELRAIYPLDAIVLLETEEGYSFLYPINEEFLSVPLTDENLRGVTKKVTDEAEKNGTISMIQNELETDFDDGMKVYFDGENFCLLIRGDMGYHYISNVQRDYEYQQSLKEEDPESYREMEEEGRIIPYDVPNLDLDQIWYAFYTDPNIEPMKPITTEATAEEIAAEETTASIAETGTKPVEPSTVPVETNTVPVETNTVPVEPGTTVSESGSPTWETDKYDGQPNPGMPARATNDLMYGGEEYYLFIEIAPFIYGEDGKCYFLLDGRKTVQEPGYRIKENLYAGEALTALLRDREPVGKLTYTDGALNADFEVTLKEFDGADLYENGNPKDNYGLTLVSTEPLCYVDGTAVYLTADATLRSR